MKKTVSSRTFELNMVSEQCDKHSARDVDNILPIKLTYVTLWDVAHFPSFVLVSGVAPDAFVFVRISAEIVVAYVRESVFVRLLF